jgi:hypothetical protein
MLRIVKCCPSYVAVTAAVLQSKRAAAGSRTLLCIPQAATQVKATAYTIKVDTKQYIQTFCLLEGDTKHVSES